MCLSKERFETRFGILGMVRGFGDTGGDIAARLIYLMTCFFNQVFCMIFLV